MGFECEKRSFDSAEAAMKHGRFLRKKGVKGLSPYFCVEHHAYHVGLHGKRIK